MINLETLKRDIYQRERKKLFRRFSLFNVLVVFVIFFSLSNVGVSPREKELLNRYKEVVTERDSLKTLAVNVLSVLQTNGNEIRSKYLTMSIDTNYIDDKLNVESMYENAKYQMNEYESIEKVINNRWDSISKMPVGNPISLGDLDKYTDGFGYRKHPIYHRIMFHEGVDIVAPFGSDVFATGDGFVEKVVENGYGYGNRIVINHGNGFKTVYAHLDGFNVIVGQRILKNDLIGWLGNTGVSTGPHLHYEVLVNNRPIDP